MVSYVPSGLDPAWTSALRVNCTLDNDGTSVLRLVQKGHMMAGKLLARSIHNFGDGAWCDKNSIAATGQYGVGQDEASAQTNPCGKSRVGPGELAAAQEQPPVGRRQVRSFTREFPSPDDEGDKAPWPTQVWRPASKNCRSRGSTLRDRYRCEAFGPAASSVRIERCYLC